MISLPSSFQSKTAGIPLKLAAAFQMQNRIEISHSQFHQKAVGSSLAKIIIISFRDGNMSSSNCNCLAPAQEVIFKKDSGGLLSEKLSFEFQACLDINQLLAKVEFWPAYDVALQNLVQVFHLEIERRGLT